MINISSSLSVLPEIEPTCTRMATPTERQVHSFYGEVQPDSSHSATEEEGSKK